MQQSPLASPIGRGGLANGRRVCLTSGRWRGRDLPIGDRKRWRWPDEKSASGMSALSERLATLPPEHQQALQWFWDRQGDLIGWPEPLNGLFLVNRPKGIHKPKGWIHALSVRQALKGPYADRPPEGSFNTSWSYDYFQEGQDPATRDNHATNRGLMACWTDNIPVAVLIQEKSKPGVRYRVWGLARVDNWTNGHFKLEGYNPAGELGNVSPANGVDIEYDIPGHTPVAIAEPYEPFSTDDARKRIHAQIVARQGGTNFRSSALKTFQGRCAISGCDVPAVLEAAHIVPYRGKQTNSDDNALLLRADLHTLFDRLLLFVDPETLVITLADELASSEYAMFADKPLSVPLGVDPKTIGLRLGERVEALKVAKSGTGSPG